MTTSPPHLIVIGAGVAGLAAARALRGAGATVTVLERAAQVGGRMQTAVRAGCQYELGAEFLASFYTRTLALIRELGLARDLRRIPSSAAILRGGRLFSLWPNARLAFTPLIGPRHKLALSYLLGSLVRHGPLLDIQAFQRAHPIDDAPVSTYALAHLSEDLLEYVLQPPLSGIFYWTPERTSRALLLLVLRAGLSRPTGMQLFTMREGLGQIPRALARGLDVRLGAEVCAVETIGGGHRVCARFGTSTLDLRCDGVVVATTASAVAAMLPGLDAEQRGFFAAVGYSRTAQLTVITRRRLPRDYYGLLFPRRETPYLASATIQTVKQPQAAPRGRDVLCLHLSGPAATALRECDDAMLAELMLAELRRLSPRYDPSPHAIFQGVSRWEAALPEFDVGHFRRLQRFAEGAIERGGPLVFAGDYLGGPFVEGAILSGEAAAARLLERLRPH